MIAHKKTGDFPGFFFVAGVRNNLAAGMKLCEQHQDYVSRDMLLVQLKDTEEDHAWWLEQQLGLIKRIGLALYQTSKMDAKGTAAH